MALMLAPYNSAMRLGMGFNSYTQALCVNDVVRKPGNMPATEGDLRAAQLTEKSDAATTKVKQLPAASQELPPESVLDGAKGTVTRKVMDGQKEVSQVVSWEATFVNNSSDVLNKLDVSGALSIKMAGLGSLSGKAGFVDSTTIKKADVNYLIHVRVVNQRLNAENITEFCPIDYVDPGQFTEIYGDCFISGFIEGGEFDALISITTMDTMKKNSITGELELSANISGVDVSGSVKGGKDDNSDLKNAQTKISVTWSGGGDIREDGITEWNLENLKEVAMSFPDAVAACPQRVSAILTKYTSLRSYHEQTKKGSPLDYENAGVYTAALYDAYTDYKIMWKEIQAMISLLNAKDIQLYIQEASEGLTKYAATVAAAYLKKEADYKAAIEAQKTGQSATALVPLSSRFQAMKIIEKPLPANKVVLYDPDIFGLEVAASDCRFEMIKIVREVDEVTKDPKVACDPSRTSQYLSPSVFRLLIPKMHKDRLPTVEQWKNVKDNLDKKDKDVQSRDKEISEIKKKLEATLITPRKDEHGTLLDHTANPAKEIAELHPSLQTSLSKLAYRADEHRMQSLLEDNTTISTGATFFNDLEFLERSARPSELRVWNDDKAIRGICIVYTAGKEITHGKREGNPQSVLALDLDEVITELDIQETKDKDDKLTITYIAAATSKCNILMAGTKAEGKTYRFSMADHQQWSFRGFFGFIFTDNFENLGIVWGRDMPSVTTSTIQTASTKSLLGMSPELQLKAKKALSGSKPAEHFYLGDCISVGAQPSTTKTFSAIDTISGSSKIRKLCFCASAGRLSGLKVDYSDGKQLVHGAYSEEAEVWNCEVRAPIVAAKLTVGKAASNAQPFFDTVELVCGDEDGGLPLWPLDVSTIRYLGDHADAEHLEVVSKLTEQAPKLGRANWSLRGFYGEESQGLITRLGLIWGCA